METNTDTAIEWLRYQAISFLNERFENAITLNSVFYQRK